MLFDWSTFFYASLSIFFNDHSLLFARREITLELGVFIFGGWMACFA
jgi:hypothetical protein